MKRFFSELIVLAVLVTIANGQGYKDLHGYVTTVGSAPLCSAVVVVLGQGKYIYALADNKGYYSFKDGGDTIVDIHHSITSPSYNKLQISNGALSFNLVDQQNVKVTLYTMKGRQLCTAVDRRLSSGSHRFPLPESIANQLLLVRVAIGQHKATFKYVPSTPGAFSTSTASTAPVTFASSRQPYMIRVSSPGYRTKGANSGSQTQVDVSLDTLIADSSTHVVEDGCLDRMTIWGKTQYFEGDLNGNGVKVPMVKIIHATSYKAIDAAIILSPHFVDNTYGANIIGWNKHSFDKLYNSDHVEFAFQDKDSVIKFQGKCDLLSKTTTATTGFACLGFKGGDGDVSVGTASDIIAYGTSLDDNINFYEYHLFVDSPKTDTAYTPNPTYPMWEYCCVYHVVIHKEAFEPKGFGKVFMSSVHASPSKSGIDTVPINEMITIGTINPFIHVQTFTVPDIQ